SGRSSGLTRILPAALLEKIAGRRYRLGNRTCSRLSTVVDGDLPVDRACSFLFQETSMITAAERARLLPQQNEYHGRRTGMITRLDPGRGTVKDAETHVNYRFDARSTAGFEALRRGQTITFVVAPTVNAIAYSVRAVEGAAGAEQ